MIAAGQYHTLLHGLKIEGERCYLHATVLPSGERVRLRMFNSQIAALMIAMMHHTWLPKNMKGGQVRLEIDIHPIYGNRLKKIIPVAKVDLLPVESDVDIDRPVQYCDFDGL